jgi:hypothetical protein
VAAQQLGEALVAGGDRRLGVAALGGHAVGLVAVGHAGGRTRLVEGGAGGAPRLGQLSQRRPRAHGDAGDVADVQLGGVGHRHGVLLADGQRRRLAVDADGDVGQRLDGDRRGARFELRFGQPQVLVGGVDGGEALVGQRAAGQEDLGVVGGRVGLGHLVVGVAVALKARGGLDQLDVGSAGRGGAPGLLGRRVGVVADAGQSPVLPLEAGHLVVAAGQVGLEAGPPLFQLADGALQLAAAVQLALGVIAAGTGQLLVLCLLVDGAA